MSPDAISFDSIYLRRGIYGNKAQVQLVPLYLNVINWKNTQGLFTVGRRIMISTRFKKQIFDSKRFKKKVQLDGPQRQLEISCFML